MCMPSRDHDLVEVARAVRMAARLLIERRHAGAPSRREGCNRQVEAEGERYAHVSEIKPFVSQRLIELRHLPRWKRQERNAFDE